MLLFTLEYPLSSEEIFAFDFIATFGKEFGLTDVSLNGDSEFTLSKITLRRKRVMESISFLVRNGYIKPLIICKTIKYNLTEKGNSFYKKISMTEYAEKYIITANLGKNDLLTEDVNPINLILEKIKEKKINE